jgi:hypothetical protein
MKNEEKGSQKSSSQSSSKKPLLTDMISEKSNVKRNESIYRRDRLKGLELDYNQYLQIHQGIFSIRCRMMNIEYA